MNTLSKLISASTSSATRNSVRRLIAGALAFCQAFVLLLGFSAPAHAGQSRKFPFSHRQVAEFNAEADRLSVEYAIDETIRQFAKVRTSDELVAKFLKELSPAEKAWAKKNLKDLTELPRLKRDGLVIRIQFPNNPQEMVIDCTEIREQRLRFNGQAVSWDSKIPLSDRIRRLNQILGSPKREQHAWLRLLLPQAQAILPAAAAAWGVTSIVVGGAAATVVIQHYGEPVLRIVDNIGCTLLAKAIGKNNLTAWGACVDTIKKWDEVAPQPESDMPSAKKDKLDKIESYSKQFDELKEQQMCDIKDKKVFSTQVYLKERKEILNITINLKPTTTVEDGVGKDPKGNDRYKMALTDKMALKSAQVFPSARSIAPSSPGTAPEPRKPKLLEMDSANKTDHMTGEDKSDWTLMKDLLGFLDTSIADCMKKIIEESKTMKDVDDINAIKRSAEEPPSNEGVRSIPVRTQQGGKTVN